MQFTVRRRCVETASIVYSGVPCLRVSSSERVAGWRVSLNIWLEVWWRSEEGDGDERNSGYFYWRSLERFFLRPVSSTLRTASKRTKSEYPSLFFLLFLNSHPLVFILLVQEHFSREWQGDVPLSLAHVSIPNVLGFPSHAPISVVFRSWYFVFLFANRRKQIPVESNYFQFMTGAIVCWN